MEYKYRKKTSVVAVVEMMFSSLLMVVLLVLTIYVMTYKSPYMSETAYSIRHSQEADNTDIYRIAAFAMLLLLLHFGFGWKLKKSTRKECSPSDAKGHANCWMIYSIVYTILLVLDLFVSPLGWVFLLKLLHGILRAVAMSFVQEYIKELKLAISTGIV